MIKIDSKQFNFQFFLSGRKKVKSLKAGAMQFGGATKIRNNIYSNIAGSEYISINDKKNKLSVFIPNTIDVDKKTDNKIFIDYAISYITNNFNCKNIAYEKTKGSWFSSDLKKVVYDNITIVSFESDTVTEHDIELMQILAEYIKNRMSQEGVTITVNSAMAIV